MADKRFGPDTYVVGSPWSSSNFGPQTHNKIVDDTGNMKKSFLMDMLEEMKMDKPNDSIFLGQKREAVDFNNDEWGRKYGAHLERLYAENPQLLKTSNPHLLHSKDKIIIDSDSPMQIVGPQARVGPHTAIVNNNTSWNGPIPLEEYEINSYDPNNVDIIRKKFRMDFDYKKICEMRLLRPPTPEPDELIIGRENIYAPSAPAYHAQVHEPRPRTPDVIYRREFPPTPRPKISMTKMHRRYIKPPPRRIILEFIPAAPPKPPKVIFERWLPYNYKLNVTELPAPAPIVEKPRNIHILWELDANVRYSHERNFLGIVNEDPNAYIARYHDLLRLKDLENDPYYRECFRLEELLKHGISFDSKYSVNGRRELLSLLSDDEIARYINAGYSRDLFIGAYGGWELNAQNISMYQFTELDIRKIFNYIDSDSNGLINREELQGIINKINRTKNREKYGTLGIDELFVKLDFDKNSHIDYNEFRSAFYRFLNQIQQNPIY